ncbi:MAG: DUF6171 family protein [Fusicatenibacter sp.]|nr:DUF6171 family protein [Fusicatenibacter sp.]
MSADIRICKKCLLREIDEAGFFKNMYDYIAHLDEEEKTPDVEYEERLAACKACDRLLSGMCQVCGCYVELRAALKIRHCPDVHPKW